MSDAAADVPPPDAVTEGGQDAASRRASFLELALALGPGLDAAGLGSLLKAAAPGLTENEPAVQKKSYKVGACGGEGAGWGDGGGSGVTPHQGGGT